MNISQRITDAEQRAAQLAIANDSDPLPTDPQALALLNVLGERTAHMKLIGKTRREILLAIINDSPACHAANDYSRRVADLADAERIKGNFKPSTKRGGF